MDTLLSKIKSPKDLKKMTNEEIEILSQEIRDFLIHAVSITGGHLASNLGVVELTLALHYIYDSPEDKIIFDVGHQSYVHKMITGRQNDFSTLRQFEGMSGFPKKNESPHDIFETGHSSTSISAALGMAIARDLKKEKNHIVAVIGDGALTGGLAFEALNHLGNTNTNMLVILNDNEMSICENVGGISNYLCKMRIGHKYRTFAKKFIDTMTSIPVVGKPALDTAVKVKNMVKHTVVPGALFDEMGINYYGPVDGHDFQSLVIALQELNKIDGPKMLHVLTQKGKGYTYAENDPSYYHGVSSFNINQGMISSSAETYSDVVGSTLNQIFKEDNNSVAITAAMITGTGLNRIENKNRIIDVGIAEGHAVTLAAGLATAGIKPYFAVYSTFLQRAYDEVVHDVCIQNLPVTFLIDRAGIVGEDGETHQGILDLSFLIPLPNMTILAPKDRAELEKMILFSHTFNGPIAIRYPRGKCIDLTTSFSSNEDILSWETVKKGNRIFLLGVGKMLKTALNVAQTLEKKGIIAEVVNPRCIKPMDKDYIEKFLLKAEYVYTIEDNFVLGGFGSSLAAMLVELGYKGNIRNFGFPDEFINQGKVEQLYKKYNLDDDSIAEMIFQEISNEKNYEEIS